MPHRLMIFLISAVSVAVTTHGATTSPRAATTEFYAAMPYESLQASLARLYPGTSPAAKNGERVENSAIFREFTMMKSLMRSQMKSFGVMAASQSGKWGVAAVKVETAGTMAGPGGKPQRQLPASISGEAREASASNSGRPGPIGASIKKVAVYEPLYCYKLGNDWKVIWPSMLSDARIAKLKNTDFAKMQKWYNNHKTMLERKDSNKDKGK